jgi:hypothetical protein
LLKFVIVDKAMPDKRLAERRHDFAEIARQRPSAAAEEQAACLAMASPLPHCPAEQYPGLAEADCRGPDRGSLRARFQHQQHA